MDLPPIIRSAERMNTLCLRAAYSDEVDERRRSLVTEFERLATSLGKLTSPNGRPNWSEVAGQASLLLVEAAKAIEASSGTMVPVGHISVISTRLRILASAFGLHLEDAATADTAPLTRPEDEPARDHVEGQWKAAAE